MEDIHNSMLEKARKHLEEHTYTASDFAEFKQLAEEKPGFIKAMWCGDRACEDAIKEQVGVTSRCIPFDQEHGEGTCIHCGKKADKMVYWGKAY